MHDLESFFWVLFWICIYYNGLNEESRVPRFEKWNYVDMEELAEIKTGQWPMKEIYQDGGELYAILPTIDPLG